MAQFHYGKIQDEARGQHMGKAMGFLAKAQGCLDSILSDKNAAKIYLPHHMD